MFSVRFAIATAVAVTCVACSSPTDGGDGGVGGGAASTGGGTAGSTGGGSSATGGGSASTGGGTSATGGGTQSTGGGTASTGGGTGTGGGDAATGGGSSATGGGTTGTGGGVGNSPPVIGVIADVSVNEGQTVNVTLAATDADADPITFALVNPPTWASLTGNSVTLSPGFSDSGQQTVSFTATDGHSTPVNGSFKVTVQNVNRAPVLNAIANVVMTAGTTKQVILSATDPDGDTITFAALNAPTFSNLAGNTFTLSPTISDLDNRQVTITATDGSLSDQKSFSLVVNAPANQPPVVTLLTQVDGTGTPVTAGATVTSPPKLRATLDDPENATVRVEAEVILTSGTFANTATHSGVLTAEGIVDLVLPSLPAGSYMWQLRGLDAQGVGSAWQKFAAGATAFVVQAGAINGSLTINAGAAATNSTSASLAITATATSPATLTEMCFSNDGVTFAPANCGAPVATKNAWVMDATEGTQAVYVRVKDSNGTTVIFSDTITLDTTPPTLKAVSINAGAAATTNTAVTLTFVASDTGTGIAGQQASNDDVTYTAISPSPAVWVVSSGDGVKTVNVRVTDGAGNSATAKGTISLDTTAPTISVATLEAGALWTNKTGNTVQLAVTAADGTGSGIAQVCVSGAATPGCQAFTGTGSVNIGLTAGDGNKSVLVTVKDAAGNISLPSNPSIGLDTQPPTLTSILLQAGAANTQTALVSVTLVASDNVGGSGLASSAFKTGALGTFSAPIAPYASPSNYTMDVGDGPKVVFGHVTDAAGNVSGEQSDGITLDTAPPSGTVVVNGGNPTYTKSTSVSLVLTATDASSTVTHYCANTTNTAPSSAADACWTLLASPGFTLPGGDGLKTVYVFFKDSAGNFSTVAASDSITLDQTAPTINSAQLANGSAFTNQLAIAFNTSASDATSGPGQICTGLVSPPTNCIAYAGAPLVTLGAGDGTKTVYVQVIDNAGNASAISSDTIGLDQTPPSLTSISLNGGATYTNNTVVPVTSVASDMGAGASGLFQIQLSNDAFGTSTSVAYGSPVNFTLTTGDAAKTVSAKVTDNAGNVSTVQTATITLDQTAPTGTVSINSGAAYTTSSTLSVALSIIEAGSGPSQMCRKLTGAGVPATPPSGAGDACFSAYATPSSMSAVFEGDRQVNVWVLDNAGNIGGPLVDTIFYDATPPPAPTAVTVSNVGHRTMTVSWSASVDANGSNGSGVGSYDVFEGTTTGGPYRLLTSVTAPTTNATLSPISNESTHYVVVRAVDKAAQSSGNSSEVNGLPRYGWVVHQRLPSSNTVTSLTGVTASTRTFMTMGPLLVSTDDFSTFQYRDALTDQELQSVRADTGGNILAVGTGGHFAVSLDNGLSFTKMTNADVHQLNDVSYAGTSGSGFNTLSHYVAVGAAGTIVHGTASFFSNMSSVTAIAPAPGGASTLTAVTRCVGGSAGVCDGVQLVAVGTNGMVLRSINNGVAWSQVSVPAAYATAPFTGVAQLPGTDTLYAIGAVSGHSSLLRSTNGGVSWLEFTTTPATTETVQAISVFGTDLWLAGSSAPTLVKVTSLGARTVQTVPGYAGLYYGVYARSTSEIIIGGTDGDLVRTTNGTVASPTWAHQTAGTMIGFNSISIPPGFSNTVWVVGNGGYIAKNSLAASAPASWVQQTSTVNATLNHVAAINGNIVHAVGSGGTIVSTANGGTTWAEDAASTIVTTNNLMGLSCRATTGAEACLAVGAQQTVLKWDGTTWTTKFAGGALPDFRAVTNYLDNQASPVARAIIVGDSGSIRTITGTGAPVDHSVATANPLFAVGAKKDGSGVVIAVGSNGVIYKSTDHGATWAQKPAGLGASLTGVEHATGTTWYATGSSSATLIKSIDDGETWFLLVPMTSNMTMTCLTVSTASPNRLWVGGNSGTILYSGTSGQ